MDEIAQLRSWLLVLDEARNDLLFRRDLDQAVDQVQTMDDATFEGLMSGLVLSELPQWSRNALTRRATA